MNNNFKKIFLYRILLGKKYFNWENLKTFLQRRISLTKKNTLDILTEGGKIGEKEIWENELERS